MNAEMSPHDSFEGHEAYWGFLADKRDDEDFGADHSPDCNLIAILIVGSIARLTLPLTSVDLFGIP